MPTFSKLNSLFTEYIEIDLVPENETRPNGLRPYTATITDTDVGIIQSIDHQLRAIDQYLADATAAQTRLKNQITNLQNEVTQPWKHLAEYRQMRHHYEQLAIELQSKGISRRISS